MESLSASNTVFNTENFYKHMAKLFILPAKFIIFLTFIFLCGCEEALPPLIVNAHDPASKYFTPDPAGDLRFRSIDRSSVRIIWTNKSNFAKAFLIEKTDITTQRTEYITLPSDSTSFTDKNLDIYGKYRYVVATKGSTEYSSNSDTITIHYEPYTVNIYNTAQGTGLLQISGNSQRCFVSVQSGLDIYDISSGKLKFLSNAAGLASNTVNKLSWDGSIIAYAGNYLVGYYDINNSRNIILKNTYSIENKRLVDISSDKRYMVTCRSDGRIELWDLQKNVSRSFQLPPGSSPMALAISPDNRFIVSRDGSSICFWDINTFNLYAAISGTGYYENSPWTFNDDGNIFVYYDINSGELKFWDVGSKTTYYKMPHAQYGAIKLISSGEFMLVSSNSQLMLYRITNNIPAAPLRVFDTKGDYKFQTISIGGNGAILIGDPSLLDTKFLVNFKDSWKYSD
jgi:WD40 repeat protein